MAFGSGSKEIFMTQAKRACLRFFLFLWLQCLAVQPDVSIQKGGNVASLCVYGQFSLNTPKDWKDERSHEQNVRSEKKLQEYKPSAIHLPFWVATTDTWTRCIALLSVSLPVLLSGVFEGCPPLLRDLTDDISFSKVPLPKKEHHRQNPGNLIGPLVDWMSGSRRFCPLKWQKSNFRSQFQAWPPRKGDFIRFLTVTPERPNTSPITGTYFYLSTTHTTHLSWPSRSLPLLVLQPEGHLLKKGSYPAPVHWKEGGRYSCIALANASSNSPSLYHKNEFTSLSAAGLPQRSSMIHFDSGGSLNGTSHSFTFEEDTLLVGKAWESIKFSHISKAGPNRQCTRLCVRVDFDSIKVSLSKNSVSSIWISSCRGFAAFFGRTPTTSYEYNPPLSSNKIRVLPPLAAPHGVSLAQVARELDVGRPVLLVLVRARELAQAQVQAPQRRVSQIKVEWIDGSRTAYRHFRHGFPLKGVGWVEKDTQRGDWHTQKPHRIHVWYILYTYIWLIFMVNDGKCT